MNGNKGEIIDTPIQPLVYSAYGQYSVDTQTRHIPRIEDTFILSVRRILARIMDTKALTKSAKIVGDILGKYHPHGDTAVYGAMEKIASTQASFPLILGKGNWGDLRNSRGAAAYRYTECMMHTNFENALDDESMKRAGVYTPNFSGDTVEPYFLMTKIPLGLLNNTNGTIVGTSIAIPSFNVNEIIDACIAIITGAFDISTEMLAGIVIAPDHRLYDCEYHVDRKEWMTILETGFGNVLSVPRAHMEEGVLRITGLPYNQKIADFINYAYVINDKLMKKYNKRAILKRALDESSDSEFVISVSFVSTTKKDEEINNEFARMLIGRASSKTHFRTYTCEQISEETPSLSDGATYKVDTTGIKHILIEHQKRRKDYKLKALLIKLKELEVDLDAEDLKMMIAKDSLRFFKIISESPTTKEAIINVAKEYKKSEEISERVINSTFGAFVNKQERIRATIDRLTKELKDTKHKIKNIDQYLIDELTNLKSKIGRERTSFVKEVFNISTEIELADIEE